MLLWHRGDTQSDVRAGANGKVADSFTSIHDAPLHWTGRPGAREGGGGHEGGLPPESVLQEIDAQELNRMFVRRCGAPAASCAPGCLIG